MSRISEELVDRYIRNAGLVAESDTEHSVVEMASEINSPRPIRRRRNPYNEEAEHEVRSWRKLILNEIHAALCTKSARYKKYVAAMKHSGDVLILAIAAAVANKVAANVVVVAALVAALLRMIFAMGVSVFCKGIDEGLI